MRTWLGRAASCRKASLWGRRRGCTHSLSCRSGTAHATSAAPSFPLLFRRRHSTALSDKSLHNSSLWHVAAMSKGLETEEDEDNGDGEGDYP